MPRRRRQARAPVPLSSGISGHSGSVEAILLPPSLPRDDPCRRQYRFQRPPVRSRARLAVDARVAAIDAQLVRARAVRGSGVWLARRFRSEHSSSRRCDLVPKQAHRPGWTLAAEPAGRRKLRHSHPVGAGREQGRGSRPPPRLLVASGQARRAQLGGHRRRASEPSRRGGQARRRHRDRSVLSRLESALNHRDARAVFGPARPWVPRYRIVARRAELRRQFRHTAVGR